VKVEVDADLCQGHAMCELEAPGVFRTPKSGPVVIVEAEPPAALHEAVRRAVIYCPTRALSIEESSNA